MFDFRDHKVLVTGGTRGIGAAISSEFLAAGAEVTATFVNDSAHAEAFLSACPHPDRLRLARFDVADYGAVETFFSQQVGPYEVVIANAGIRRDGIVGMLPREDWRRVLAVNLDGTFHVFKFAVQGMSRQRYGRLIAITSPIGELGFAGQANYAASKAGQAALTRSLAKEVATRNITVNCVSPGYIDTDLLSDIDQHRRHAFLDGVPMKRFGTVEEVAHAVLFLSSRQASYITGTTLEVTGGV